MKRVFAHIGFSMALTLIVLNKLNADITLIISAVLAILLIVSIAFKKIRNKVAVPLCLGAALVGCLIFMVGNYMVSPQLNLSDKTVNASVYYIDIPEISDDGCSYIVKTVGIDDANAPQNIKLKIKTDEEINAEPYQVINAKLKLSKYQSNYSKGIYLSADAEDISVTNSFVASPWLWVYNLRLDIINTLSNTLKGDVGSLASALVTGYKKGLSDKLYSAFKFSGAVHLIAVSGFHLSILIAVLFFVLKLFNANDTSVAIIGTVFIIICIGLGGFSKSVIRAGIMSIIMLVGNASKNGADALNSLGLAVSIMCLNPYAVTDVGMQLSVLSTLALITFAPKIAKYNIVIRLAIIPWIIILFTFPVMAISFGYVSIAGIISNIFVGLVGSCSLVLSIISYLSLKTGLLASIFVPITKGLITLLINIVSAFSSLRFAVVPLDNEIEYIAIGASAMLFVALVVNKSKWRKTFGAIAFLMVYASIFASVLLNLNTANVLVTQNGAVAVAYKDEGYCYGIKNKSDFYTAKTFLFANHIEIDSIDDYHNLKNINAFESSSECAVDVNGITVAVGYDKIAGADISVCNDYVYDSNGKISLENGDIVYKIKSNSSYEANWLN